MMEWKYGPATTQSTTSIPIQSQIKTTFCFEFVWLNGLMVDEFVGGRPTIAAQLLPSFHPSTKKTFFICWLDSIRGRKEMKANQQPTFIEENVGWLLSLFFLQSHNSRRQNQSLFSAFSWMNARGEEEIVCFVFPQLSPPLIQKSFDQWRKSKAATATRETNQTIPSILSRSGRRIDWSCLLGLPRSIWLLGLGSIHQHNQFISFWYLGSPPVTEAASWGCSPSLSALGKNAPYNWESPAPIWISSLLTHLLSPIQKRLEWWRWHAFQVASYFYIWINKSYIVDGIWD